MPRDATDTRDRLLAEAERLFASRGVHQATTREIVEAAGQRNASALSYHFGSRTAVLHEILRRHGDPIDAERARLVADPGIATTRELVAGLLLAYATALDTASGRRYLRIVAQLTDQFPVWRVEGDLNPPHLRHMLIELERRAGGDPDTARERVVAIIMLLTASVAERARLVDLGLPLGLDTDRFLGNLADLIVAAAEAPVGPPVSPPLAVR